MIVNNQQYDEIELVDIDKNYGTVNWLNAKSLVAHQSTPKNTEKWLQAIDLNTKMKKNNKIEPLGKLPKTKNKIVEHIIKENIGNEFGIGCIKMLYNPHVTIKLFWFVCLLASLAISSYLFIGIFKAFFNYEVNTSIREIFETPMLYPEIIICNQNALTTSDAYDLKQDPKFPIDLLELNETVKLKIAHSLDDILLSCVYNGIECTSRQFFPIFDRNKGYCYAFNSGNNSSGQTVNLERSVRAGSDYGLQLTMYANYYEKLSKYNAYIGLELKVVNSSYYGIDEGILLSPGYLTNVAMHRFFEIMLPKPYSNCDIPNESTQTGYSYIFDEIYHSNYEYTQQLCLDLCYQKYVKDACKCNPYDYPFFGGTICENSDENCIDNITRIFLKSDYIVQTCMPMCPLQCNQTGFTTSISFSQLNGDAFISKLNGTPSLSADFLSKPISGDQAKNSIVQVNIFYDTLSYTLADETPACEWICLLADIGGILGLFMGASVLSIGEVIEVLIEVFFIYKGTSKHQH